MKAQLYLLTLLFSSFVFTSYSREVLTREEAQKQLLNYTQQLLHDNFCLDKYMYHRKLPDNVINLKKAGYIDLVKTGKKGVGDFEVKVMPKGKPFFISENKDFLYFKLINMSVSIISVKPSAKGDVCYVEYKENIALTIFFKTWDPHCFEDGVRNHNARFVWAAGKWKLDEPWL